MSQASTGGSTNASAQENEIIYSGTVIHQRDEMLSLTDMWKAAGADRTRPPAEWIRSKDAKRFIDFLAETLMLGNSQHELFQVVRGGNAPSTWAHWQIGLAYAKYLSPEFHIWCNTVIRERMETMRGQPAAAFSIQISPQDVRAELSRQVAVILRDSLPAALATILPAAPPAPMYIPMIQLLMQRGVECKKRGQLSKHCAMRFVKWLTANGRTADFKLSTETKRFLFNPSAADDWFDYEGDTLVSDHKLLVELTPINLTKYRFRWESADMKTTFGPDFPTLQHRGVLRH